MGKRGTFHHSSIIFSHFSSISSSIWSSGWVARPPGKAPGYATDYESAYLHSTGGGSADYKLIRTHCCRFHQNNIFRSCGLNLISKCHDLIHMNSYTSCSCESKTPHAGKGCCKSNSLFVNILQSIKCNQGLS